MPKPLHLKTPQAQHTLISTDKSIKIFLDEQQQLLVKPESAPYPYVLDVQTVHALANLLMLSYQDIVREASKYNGPKEIGRKDEW
jgi:hypothetical protein